VTKALSFDLFVGGSTGRATAMGGHLFEACSSVGFERTNPGNDG